MNTVALIPVRGGSKRVKNKNLAPFAGRNLLEIKITQLKEVRGINSVVVSSEDDAMLEIADRMGVLAMKRDPYYATDDIPMSEVYKYMATQVSEETILLTHVTSPLITAKRYSEAIRIFKEMGDGYDSLTTVSAVKEFLFLDGKALNFDPRKKPRSQDLPNIVKLNHAVSILPRELMIAEKSCAGKKPYFLEVSELESVDIDTPLDFDIAEFLYLKHISQNDNLC